MKNLFQVMVIILPLFLITSCNSDDDNSNPFMGETKTYDLASVADPSISGTATFIENENGSTTIELQLTGTPDGGMHPAHIHVGDATQSGVIALSLGTVDGTSGFSTVTTSVLDFGDEDTSNDVAISFDELLEYDGYINVHLSADDLGTLVAQGDIGENELTGAEKIYNLGSVDVDDISGTAKFSERVNGETLVELELEGTPEGGMHPSHIHINTAAEGGGIAIGLGVVDGDTGKSVININTLDFNDEDESNDIAITYDELLDYDGYINVHLSADDLGTIVAQGDIGQNELINSITYPLNTLDVDDISGNISFSERANGEVLAILDIEGTPEDGIHPAHIHAGSVAEAPGAVILTFDPVDGESGTSKANYTELNDGTPFTYSSLLTIDGYVNVHLSADEIETIVAQGNIGANN